MSENMILKGEVELVFVRAGVKKTNNKPYLMLSNGIATFFANVPKNYDMSQFENLSEGDTITCIVAQRVGSDNVNFIDLLS